MTNFRIGHGLDVHRFGGAGPLILGGVRIPHEMGLVAHSDGDVLVHAVCDALLGALALGDIGQLFPDTDPAFSGADSRGLLRTVMQLVWKRGFVVGNLDVTVAAQKPRLAPHEAQMRANLAGDMHVEVDRVSIKATTTEGLGFTGRAEGICAQAVVLLVREK